MNSVVHRGGNGIAVVQAGSLHHSFRRDAVAMPAGFRLICCLMLLASAQLALAGTWYVAPNGDDSAGDGSAAHPWKTIRHATARAPDEQPTILLRDGLYADGQSATRAFTRTCVVRAENPYRARLSPAAGQIRALSCYGGANITFQGLEICGSGEGKGEYLVHVCMPTAHHLIFQDCIIHDGYGNDMVKINDGAHDIGFRRCVFYNPTDHEGDQHLDINTVTDIVIEDSILFDDYAGSQRVGAHKGQGFIVIKNSGSTPDVTCRIAVRRCIFLNFDGRPDQAFLLLGEDGKPFYEAQKVTIENNLFIHNSPIRTWGTLLLKGGLRDISVRANTVVGHPAVKYSGAFAAVCLCIGKNPPMSDIRLCNNIWCDDTGQMPRLTISGSKTFAAGSQPAMQNNLYWNGGKPIPTETSDTLVPERDSRKVLADPRLPTFDAVNGLVPPRWDAAKGQFVSGQKTIGGEFEHLVLRYAVPAAGSPALGAADPATMPADDILGTPRGDSPDIGCYQAVKAGKP
ncbi:MAG: hypothetical protein ABSH20_04070 [Tepidisphaeraceae bacterium]